MQALQDAAVQFGIIAITTLGPIILAGVAGILALAFNRWRIKLGAEANTVAMANWSGAAVKSNTQAIMENQAAIAAAARGLADLEVQAKVLERAAAIMAEKFPTTAADNGVEPETEKGKAQVRDVVTRALPEAATNVAASGIVTPVPAAIDVPAAGVAAEKVK